MSERLKGKTAFVTAAGQGMGRASALALAAEGATVWASDINGGLLDSLKASGLHTLVLDVRDSAAVQAAAAQVGEVDVLFNCAGFVHNGSILDCSEADWDFSFDLNVKGMYRVTRAFLPGLLERAQASGAASVINMASMCSSLKGFPNRFAYGTTKAAVIGFTKSVAMDFVKQGLRCNAICPGTVDTPSLRGRIDSAVDPVQAEKDFIARQPMGRLATVDDIAPLVVYLASDESRFMTGAALSVDGGVSI
jgi:2-keto-3-deoxy-L-fuconate dehydrogenase